MAALAAAATVTTALARIATSAARRSPASAAVRAAAFSTSCAVRGVVTPVKVVFRDSKGNAQTVTAEVGQNLLDIAHNNDIELEGACGGTLACSTCHLIVDKKFYDKLQPPVDEELDMLDLAWGLTETSRLGCQICMTPELSGISVTIPAETADARDV
eukprot:m.53133 g.53133  ORF g.53133 m.53133 type:complete len:158 (-) comp13131_c0_seq3:200-673(-)